MSLPDPDIALLRPLERLSTLSEGLPKYYVALADGDDEVLRAVAWRGLTDTRSVPFRLHDKLIADSRNGAVQRRAFDYFLSIFSPDLAERALSAAPNQVSASRALMRATLANDAAGKCDAETALFLESGIPQHLANAADEADIASGWRASIPLAARNLVAFPTSPLFLMKLFLFVDASGRADIAAVLADHLGSAPPLKHVAAMTRALAALLDGKAGDALAELGRIQADPTASQPIAPFMGHFRRIEAEAHHKLGQTQRAYVAYKAVHEFDKGISPSMKPAEFVHFIQVRAELPVPPLPPDQRKDVVQMLGFPRSGTTLLENALAAHNAVETFEEVPTLSAATTFIERVLQQRVPWSGTQTDLYVAGRERYYQEIDRLRRKDDASVLVDKLPIRSGEAKFIAKLFPEWRYIFSIRHPYDVVLSCFRQRFAPNRAMENFRTIEGGARLYDFCMTQWFGVHGLDDPAVHYMRYDELATDFRPVMERTLGFLGLPWDETVMDFAAKAEQRASRTPSYQKVRQGLSVGVQTYWRKYDFLWQTPEARPLQKWAEFFGYPTK